MSTLVASNLQAAGGAGTVATLASVNGGAIAGTRNRIINGGMAIDQRNAGASQTFNSADGWVYCVDRWYAACAGANATGQRIQGASVGQFRYQITGAASVSAIAFGQRIEQLNSADLAGTTATLSVDLANSVLTTVTWTAYYATTADTFGTRASPTVTQIATGTFTVNSTVTRYSTNISVPAAATTGIEIRFTVGAQTSGTWTIGDVQLEQGTVATPFERRSYGQELGLCQRYYQASPLGALAAVHTNNTIATVSFRLGIEMRASPTIAQATTAVYLIAMGPSNTTDLSTTNSTVDLVVCDSRGVARARLNGFSANPVASSIYSLYTTGKFSIDAEL
jgi:hypothetical protein